MSLVGARNVNKFVWYHLISHWYNCGVYDHCVLQNIEESQKELDLGIFFFRISGVMYVHLLCLRHQYLHWMMYSCILYFTHLEIDYGIIVKS